MIPFRSRLFRTFRVMVLLERSRRSTRRSSTSSSSLKGISSRLSGGVSPRYTRRSLLDAERSAFWLTLVNAVPSVSLVLSPRSFVSAKRSFRRETTSSSDSTLSPILVSRRFISTSGRATSRPLFIISGPQAFSISTSEVPSVLSTEYRGTFVVRYRSIRFLVFGSTARVKPARLKPSTRLNWVSGSPVRAILV